MRSRPRSSRFRGSTKRVVPDEAAGALASAVPRPIGRRRYTHGRFEEALGRWVPGRTSAPCVVHTCSTAAGITAPQTVVVSGGSAAASAPDAPESMRVVAGQALDAEPLQGSRIRARFRFGRQLAQLDCGDSLASASAWSHRFGRLHEPSVSHEFARLVLRSSEGSWHPTSTTPRSIRCQPRGARRCLRRSWPVWGASSRTWASFHCTWTRRPIQPGGVPTYRFLRRYLDRRPVALLSRRQVDPLIRQLTLYRDLIDRRTGDPS